MYCIFTYSRGSAKRTGPGWKDNREDRRCFLFERWKRIVESGNFTVSLVCQLISWLIRFPPNTIASNLTQLVRVDLFFLIRHHTISSRIQCDYTSIIRLLMSQLAINSDAGSSEEQAKPSSLQKSTTETAGWCDAAWLFPVLCRVGETSKSFFSHFQNGALWLSALFKSPFMEMTKKIGCEI